MNTLSKAAVHSFSEVEDVAKLFKLAKNDKESGFFLDAVEKFDQVIFACHSDQALNLLEGPTQDEKNILQSLPYQENDVTLHTDTSLMPKRKLAWASWNFLAGERKTSDPPIVPYCMNILQGIQSEVPFLVSLNARSKIDPKKILREFKK